MAPKDVSKRPKPAKHKSTSGRKPAGKPSPRAKSQPAGKSASRNSKRPTRKPDDPKKRSNTSGVSSRDLPVWLHRVGAFLVERHPWIATAAFAVVDETRRSHRLQAEPGGEDFRVEVRRRLESKLRLEGPRSEAEPTPGTSRAAREAQALHEICEEVDGALVREQIRASLTPDERREILRGMILTRATDNELKHLFTTGEVRYGSRSFQGKGFRSLGQEAIYAAAIRLRRGSSHMHEGSVGYGIPIGSDPENPSSWWSGDVVAPMIRDLGVVLAMHPAPEMVRMVINAQMGKAGPPMDGRDLHVGDLRWGVLPAAAPLGIPTLTISGMAMGFQLSQSGQVAVSFIGDGGCSLGEWHEAINLCAARRLPAIFCVQNNQTALSTPLLDQTAVRVFADKAIGYGIPGATVDGTDPEAIAAAFAWAADRARRGEGPALIELVAMRMCGHAHHDDMLYLGKEPSISWSYPNPSGNGYVDRRKYGFWSERDPIPTYAAVLREQGLLEEGELHAWKKEAEAMVRAEAEVVIAADWPKPETVGMRVVAQSAASRSAQLADPRELQVESAPPFDPKGRTYLEAIMLGVGDALVDERVFVYGQDVGGDYGNAFLLLRPLLEKYRERILNSTLAEGGVLGVCIGAALAGHRPIGEIQFNDFVATGFNQLVNNAAKIRYRWGGSVPMVVRMPYGGLRSAGPFHSQDTSPWFYRTPGLKIVAPSTPHDARALLQTAVADPDPVLYYEHIALYRDPRIKQLLPDEAPEMIPLGKAALRRTGGDLLMISYGAYVHHCLRVAEVLARDGIESTVLDLRTLAPLDRAAILDHSRRIGRVLIAHEDTRTGGIGESIAAIIQEEAFESLDAPVRVIGSLDTPVPYAPSLEEAFLAGDRGIEEAARDLLEF